VPVHCGVSPNSLINGGSGRGCTPLEAAGHGFVSFNQERRWRRMEAGKSVSSAPVDLSVFGTQSARTICGARTTKVMVSGSRPRAVQRCHAGIAKLVNTALQRYVSDASRRTGSNLHVGGLLFRRFQAFRRTKPGFGRTWPCKRTWPCNGLGLARLKMPASVSPFS
jgi:hypothetical protein